ncbi:MAG: hypothetical protein JWN03_2486 [Nocardia sp.]|uniref:aggregation-promoting factor C-terminal-like domain-containing protein n=1 Tax=Nocardia sp. TaxID=1821 RepID=UPI002603387A|nr:hypothetical protein [Nocardia sp.]MCU1642211.1 hypothetical protein [Nocardia sp.]
MLLVVAAPIVIGAGSPTAQATPDEQVVQLVDMTSSALQLAAKSLGPVATTLIPTVTALGLDPSSAFPRPVLKAMALTVVPLDQFGAFDEVIAHESSWRVFAVNPSSGAYGLAQALPALKMFSAGPDWLVNPMTQLRWAYRYMVERYGSPAAAWDFWQSHHWY